MQPPSSEARLKHRVAELLLAERTARRLVALAVDPPPYILKELGERPADASKGRVWERGVESIDRYRREHGINDRYKALGREPKGGGDRAAWKVALKRLEDARRDLRGESRLARSRQIDRAFELNREIGL